MAPTIQVLNSDFGLTIQALFMNSVLFKGLLGTSGGWWWLVGWDARCMVWVCAGGGFGC